MKHKQKVYKEPTWFGHGEVEEARTPLSSFSEDELIRSVRMDLRFQANSNDFRDEIPEFEGKLDPDEFLEWTHTIKRVFELKDILDDKKVKLVALSLRKYVSLWWTNLCPKRKRNRKSKIRT